VPSAPGSEASRAGAARAIGKLLNSLATATESAGSVSETMQWALDLVCDYTGWPLGHVYHLSADGTLLEPTETWHDDDPEAHKSFVEMTQRKPLAAGVGLPGRILATRAAASIPDVVADSNFPRAPAALESGIRAGFGFPILTDRGIEGVMEFFSPHATEPDAELLELLSHVGVQVGQLLDRIRAREALLTSEKRMRNLVEGAPDGLVVVGEDGRITLVNDETERLTGYDRDELIGERVEILIPERLRGGHLDHRTRYAHSPQRRAMGAGRELVLRHRDGSDIPVDISLSPIDAAEGLVMVALRDTNERRREERRRRRMQDELKHQQEVLEGIARSEPLDETLMEIGRHLEARFTGARCSVLLVNSAEKVLRHAASPSLPQSFRDAIDGLPIAEGSAVCGTAAHRGEIVVVRDTEDDPLVEGFGELAAAHRIRSVWSHPLTRSTGEVVGTFAIYRSHPHEPDEAELAAVAASASLASLAIERSIDEEALTAAATIDSLTGLPNRVRFLETVTEKLAGPNPRIAVMFLDVDRFKLINDSLGHPAGDRVLVSVCDRLERAVGEDAVLARFGGDEFTILLPDVTPGRVEWVADRIDEAFTAPFVLDGGEFFLSVSIGIAVSDHPGDAYALIRDADAAMYAAKERGLGHRALFDEQLGERVLTRVRVESELRRAIENDEFEMHYQPILDLRTHRWSSVEALVRWRHPQDGLRAPDRFIPIAEETGLIVPLGAKILEMVVGQAAELAAIDPELRMSANVSVVQLADPEFAADLAAILRDGGLAPDRLLLEVTESAFMERLEKLQSSLTYANALGVTVQIDDFGTGYSSIARLGALEIGGVKIDRAFTNGLGSDPSVDRVLEAITNLAHAHDLDVVVEGIETGLALARVEELGCEYAQGFYLARPVPAGEIGSVLAAPPPRGWGGTPRL
jgi:diguanylate cyclase (GGDEF)-like protein/PAS domain S-box-containing protein